MVVNHIAQENHFKTNPRSLIPDFDLELPAQGDNQALNQPDQPAGGQRANRGRGRRNNATPDAATAAAGALPEDYEAQLAAAVAEADLLQEAVAEGAVGGVQVGGGTELRLGVNNLLDALRNLLTNLQPVGNVDGGEEGEMDEEDEWSDVEDETDDNFHVDE